MKMLTALSLPYLLFMSITLHAAVKVVQCENELGEKTFSSSCPPGTTEVTSKKYQTAIPGPEQPDVSALIYLAPDCPACEAYKKFFTKYGIRFEEKNIEGNADLQTELTQISGELKIPTVQVNDRWFTDYKENDLIGFLEEIGFTLVEPE